jgi:hypothetical protein
MFEGLEEAIRDIRLPVDGDALAELIALRDRLDLRIGQAVVAFRTTSQRPELPQRPPRSPGDAVYDL